MDSYNGDNLYNINLHCVLDVLNHLMHTHEFCTCEICLDDVCALTLSKMPPSYTTSMLEKDKKIKQIDLKELEERVKKVIALIAENPHH